MKERPQYYKLVGKDIEPLDDVIEWAHWKAENADACRVAFDKNDDDTVHVSTVFLGMDHNYSDAGLPVVFETMIFGGEHDLEMWRYCTFDEAVAGHEVACKLAIGSDVLSAEYLEL